MTKPRDKDEITPHVLLNRKTGDLLIGYRITFMDATMQEFTQEHEWVVGFLEHHGWILYHPECEVPWFMNRTCEELAFDVLGEL